MRVSPVRVSNFQKFGFSQLRSGYGGSCHSEIVHPPQHFRVKELLAPKNFKLPAYLDYLEL